MHPAVFLDEGYVMDEAALRALANEYGFAEAALCSADVFDEERKAVLSQVQLAERKQLRFEPLEDVPWIKSLAVLLWAYEASEQPAEGEVFVDSYYFASNAAYHAAKKLEAELATAGVRAKANVSYPARKAALRAGLGVIGRNSMLITPEYGSRVVIILMATDIEAPSRREDGSKCFSEQCLACGRCVEACPRGALTKEGLTHPEKCLRNYMLEGMVVPEEYRRKMGMSLVGCDVCQRVCPMQPKNSCKQKKEAFFLCEFLSADAAVFSQAAARLAGYIGKNTARPQRIRAQAALLAGNSGNPVYLPVLKNWAESDFPAVREHAIWAIGRIEHSLK